MLCEEINLSNNEMALQDHKQEIFVHKIFYDRILHTNQIHRVKEVTQQNEKEKYITYQEVYY